MRPKKMPLSDRRLDLEDLWKRLQRTPPGPIHTVKVRPKGRVLRAIHQDQLAERGGRSRVP